jgi:hypothetical protein
VADGDLVIALVYILRCRYVDSAHESIWMLLLFSHTNQGVTTCPPPRRSPHHHPLNPIEPKLYHYITYMAHRSASRSSSPPAPTTCNRAASPLAGPKTQREHLHHSYYQFHTHGKAILFPEHRPGVVAKPNPPFLKCRLQLCRKGCESE